MRKRIADEESWSDWAARAAFLVAAVITVAVALGLMGCSALSSFNSSAQHPSLAANPTICGPAAMAIAELAGASSYTAALDAVVIGIAGCTAESSVANGQPATTTTTTTTTASTSKAP